MGSEKKLVGLIIFANVLEYPLKKYIGFIQGVKEAPLFKNLSKKRIIKPQRLSKSSSLYPEWGERKGCAEGLLDKGKCGDGVIARIKRKGRGFSIHYSNEDFNKTYVARTAIVKTLKTSALLAGLGRSSGEEQDTPKGMASPRGTSNGGKRGEEKEIERFLHKLRRISSRNRLTHRILKETLEYQRKYLYSNNPIDILPFSRVSLANKLNISLSWISRVTKDMAIILPNGQERALSFLFPSGTEINKFRIKRLLDEEQESLEAEKINRPLSDGEIGVELEKKYGLHISRWAVNKCRKALGIPVAKRRITCYKYPPLFLNYSPSCPLTIQSVNNNLPSKPGIYEFSLKGRTIQYPKGKTEVIYIGSTKNLKKRLREHVGLSSLYPRQSIGGGGKNPIIRAFLKKNNCLFRYIIMHKGWRKEEERLYNLFVDTYGEAPKCNRVSP